MKLIQIDKDRWISNLNIGEVMLDKLEQAGGEEKVTSWAIKMVVNKKHKVWEFETEEAARAKLNDILNQTRAK